MQDVDFWDKAAQMVVCKREDYGATVSGKIEVWNTQARRKLGDWTLPGPISAAKFVDAQKIAILRAGTLEIWNWKTHRLLKTLDKTSDDQVLAVSSRGKWIATTSTIWRVKNWKVQAKLRSKNAAFIRAIAFSRDETLIVTGAWDVSDGIEGFAVKSGRALWQSRGDQEGNIAFAPTGNRVAVATTEGTLVFEARTGRKIRRIGDVYGGEISFLNPRTLVVTDEKTRLFYTFPSGKLQRTEPIVAEKNAVLSPTGQFRVGFVGGNQNVVFQP